ncbi:S-adenosylmethionine decarboxylase [Nanoarchaeota archaeon]
MNTLSAFGPHLMLDLHKCDRTKLVDKDVIHSLLRDLPGKIGMTRISEPQVMRYKDKWAETPGVTGFVILAESHISLHTFPDDDYVFMDIFSCRNFDYQAVKEFIVRFFSCESPIAHIVERGAEFNKRPVIPKLKKKITA